MDTFVMVPQIGQSVHRTQSKQILTHRKITA